MNRCTKTVKEGTEPENRNTPDQETGIQVRLSAGLTHSLVCVHSMIRYLGVSRVPASFPVEFISN